MATHQTDPVSQVIEKHLKRYLDDLGDTPPSNVYPMVISAIEKPVLEIIMNHAQQNQSLAAEYLGINRNTLRKKLIDHGLL